ncbi:hypothetical protein LEN26_010125 [Aphanomyces euteiches]|nr:hypothetical protein LEN26_010125 [Aphanomyces euteiches]
MNKARARPTSRQSKDADFIPTTSNQTEIAKYSIRPVKTDSNDPTTRGHPRSNQSFTRDDDEDESLCSNVELPGRSVFAAVGDYNMTMSFSRSIGLRSSDSTRDESLSEGMPEFTTGGRFKDQQFQTKATSKFSNFFRRRRSVSSKLDSSSISANDIYMQGYLSKQGSWRKNWKTRYFILRIDDPCLVYCDSEENREVLGLVPIRKETTVHIVSSSHMPSALTFAVENPQRKLLLEAPTQDELQRWIDKIQETIEAVSSRQEDDAETTLSVSRSSPEPLSSSMKDDGPLSMRSSTTYSSIVSSDNAKVYDIRIELLVDCGKDRMAYYVLLEGLTDDNEYRTISQTDICRSPDTNQSFASFRQAFTFLLPLQQEKFLELRFSLFRAPQADDVHFTKSPYAVSSVDMHTFLSMAVSTTGLDLPLQLAKKEKANANRNVTASQTNGNNRNSLRSHAEDSECGVNLHVTAFAPDKRLVIGLPDTTVVTAHRKYIMPTSVNPCGVVVVESLSVPKSTFSVPLAYLQFLIEDLDGRIKLLKQTVDEKKLPPIVEQYEAIQADARAHIVFLQEESRGKGNFKRSTYKKKKEWSMVSTNMHAQVMQVYNGNDIMASYTTITMGAVAVHTKGFANGGGYRMKETLVEVLEEANRMRKLKSKEQDPLMMFELFHIPVGLLSSAGGTVNGNKSYDPISVARKAWFELERRHHSLCIQILSATAAQICTMLELAAMGSIYHTMVWRVVLRNNLLINFESLLSTQGNEGGMLEDFRVACKWLESVFFTFEVSPNMSEAISYRITRDNNYLTVTMRIPVTYAEVLPKDLATAKKKFRVLAVIFTQGVNEMQSLAHAMHSSHTQIQDQINQESFARLGHYYAHFKNNKWEKLAVPEAGYGSPFRPNIEELDSMWKEIETDIMNPLHKKNVRLLMTTSEFCRALGGGRVTCCKSGKDRTAMSVTLEQARILVQEAKALNLKHMVETMRSCGVRRENVFKNIQTHTYAFNELQRKLLPECYKPPIGTYKKGTT